MFYKVFSATQRLAMRPNLCLIACFPKIEIHFFEYGFQYIWKYLHCLKTKVAFDEFSHLRRNYFNSKATVKRWQWHKKACLTKLVAYCVNVTYFSYFKFYLALWFFLHFIIIYLILRLFQKFLKTLKNLYFLAFIL